MSKRTFVHSNLEMGYPYFGYPVFGREGNLPQWRTVPDKGDTHNRIGIRCQIKMPSGKKCYQEHGEFYVSDDFLLLDNNKMICPYCGATVKVQKRKSEDITRLKGLNKSIIRTS
jgi:hypothetical protein